MAQFLVTFPVTGSAGYRLEADTEEEAVQKAKEIANSLKGRHLQKPMGEELSDAVNPYVNDHLALLGVDIDYSQEPEVEKEYD